jgi:membrane protease YdiL (CAAX protease family)
VTALLALLAIVLVAVGTPRQAELLFGTRLGRAGRKALRAAGLVLLAVSLVAALCGDDRARRFVEWLGVIEAEALMLALVFTLFSRRRTRY